jgi:hydrogenase maturation protease
MDGSRVLVLGVGNTIMGDDGIGVWAVQALADAYDIPANVRIVDGGVAGLRLLDEIGEATFLLIVDAAKWGGAPGSIYRLERKAFPTRQGPFFSAHEIGVAELLSVLDFTGKLPQTRVIGVEPLDTETIGLELTEPLQAALPGVVAAIVEELADIGVALRRKPASAPTVHNPQAPRPDADLNQWDHGEGERYASGGHSRKRRGRAARLRERSDA